jgi:D-sedoheptulose 7-phosphate isomerase
LQKTPMMEAKEKGRLDEAGLRLSNHVAREIEVSIKVKAKLVGEAAELIAQMAVVVATQLRAGGKLIIFGNGGSAADAQHIAAEFVGRYLVEREALPAIALTTDTSALTAIGNDYGFEHVFSRQIQALAKREDVALGISTSGDSQNVVRGLTVARELGLATLGFTGQNGGKMRNLVDLCLCVPSSATPRIQEVHILVGHILVGITENILLSEGKTQSPGRVITQPR